MKLVSFAFIGLFVAGCSNDSIYTNQRSDQGSSASTTGQALALETATAPAPTFWVPRRIDSVDAWQKILAAPMFRTSHAAVRQAGLDFHESIAAQTGRGITSLPFDVTVLAPVLGSAPAVIQLPLAGFSQDDAGPMFAALATMLQENARAKIPTEVRLAGGAYRFRPAANGAVDRSPSIHFSELADVKIVAADATNLPRLIFSNPFAYGILIEKSQRVALTELSIAYDFDVVINRKTYGAVGLKGTSLGGGRIQIPGLQDLSQVGSVFSFQPTTRQWFKDNDGFHVTFEKGTKPTREEADPQIVSDARLAGIAAGEPLVVLHSRTGYLGAIHVEDSEDVTIRRVRIGSYAQMGITARGGRGLWLDQNRIQPNTGDAVSGRADGFHIWETKGDVVIENNVIEGQGDDGINLRGMNMEISSLDSETGTVTLSKIPGAYVEVGDWLGVLTSDLTPRHLVRVKRVDGTTLELDWGVESPTSCSATCRKTILSANPRFDHAGILFNLSRMSGRFIVRGNQIRNGGGRGMIMAAPNGLVAGNVIQDMAQAAILAVASNENWSTGPGPMNLVIQDNTIRRVQFIENETWPSANAAIGVGTDNQPETTELTHTVLIRRNFIGTAGNVAVAINRAKAVEVSDNVFRDLRLAPWADKTKSDAVTHAYSSSLTLTGNR